MDDDNNKTMSEHAAFEAEQKARADKFDREAKGRAAKAKRDAEIAEEHARKQKDIDDAREEYDRMALEHGLITEADIEQRKYILSQQGFDAVLPHQILAGEPRIRMAFDRNIVLILNPDEAGTRVKVFFAKGYNDVPESISNHRSLGSHAWLVDKSGKLETQEARTKRLYDASKKEAEKAA